MRMLEALAASGEPMSISAIAELVGVDQPRASRLVQQAEMMGFVAREVDPDDARRTRVALTEQGRTVATSMRRDRRDRIGTALEQFTPEERADFARLFTKFASAWADR
ncbi:MarR family winged helix-turn-helix transcriptional regulator [Microbacterium sp. NC79]|nr:MarR family winged helix-turn-helix transcriptional regulator [Microbacterium sp. NC79]